MRVGAQRIIVVGGGAAGFFAAIACAEAAPEAEVTVLERGPQFLSKVRISGGGRCNVTHACFDPRDFATRYPRGKKALVAPFLKFSARDTVAWFESRGVKLKTEADGRMFPVSDSSQTIMDCLMNAARAAGVSLRLNCGVEHISRNGQGGFEVVLGRAASPLPAVVTRANDGAQGTARPTEKSGEIISCDRLLLATGGCRAAVAGQLAVSLGHTLEPPVPSLFTFRTESPWLRSLAGISVGEVEVSVPSAKLRERGPMLVTHQGLSGPAILRLSAWGARALHRLNYRFPLQVNWLPQLHAEAIGTELKSRQAAQHRLVQQLIRTEFAVTGKSLNQDEFVTCGGVRLGEVNFKTMESKVCPGLFFAGELLDIDGITGGFNFQAAWTTGWLAGKAMAAK